MAECKKGLVAVSLDLVKKVEGVEKKVGKSVVAVGKETAGLVKEERVFVEKQLGKVKGGVEGELKTALQTVSKTLDAQTKAYQTRLGTEKQGMQTFMGKEEAKMKLEFQSTVETAKKSAVDKLKLEMGNLKSTAESTKKQIAGSSSRFSGKKCGTP